jgi:hypothetical protein
MRSIRCYVAVVIALVPVSFAAAQNRDELLATPKVQEDARPPSYADLTAEQVAEQITVVSGRNYALYGFNTPEIQIVLPRVDNSVYAEVDFADPTLFDAGGAEVPHELERGLYDHDTHHDELRLTPVEGEAPVEFARAVGTVTVRYPIRVRTVTARRGEPVTDALDVSFDGPFVTRRSRSDDDDLEATSFTGIEAFRAFDSSGRQLEAYPSAKMSVTGDLVTEIMSYWGEVAAVQLDVVDEWVTIRVAYELPEAAPLPKERSGIAPPDGHENPPTPGAKIDVQVVVETPGMVIASELGVTPDEAIGRLKQLGYPNPSGDFMVMTAVEGNIETLELFLAAGYPIDFAVDGRTALLSAIMYRHIDLAGFLVEAGADVNLADSNNATPLFHAAGICDATELVRALIEAGADPAPATRGNTTAVEMAGVMGCTDNEAIIRAALGE